MAKRGNETPKLTLSDYAYQQISQALQAGKLKPGQKLTLRQMMEMLHTSSTPIRDAMRQLSVENAIDFAPNRHIRVPLLTADELRELRDIRVLLEGRAVEIASQKVTPEVIEAVRHHDAEIRRSRDAGDLVTAMDEIYRFHFVIYEATEQPNLVSMIRGLWLRTGPYRSLLFPDYSKMERGNLRHMVIDSMEKGDASSARIFMQADTTGAMNHIISRVEAMERAADSAMKT